MWFLINPVAHSLHHSLTDECYLLEQLHKIFLYVLIITVYTDEYKDNHIRFCDLWNLIRPKFKCLCITVFFLKKYIK